jgi:hypothetical protein
MPKDTPHILLINPWIEDFAAYDFWARPLGLLTIAGVLRKISCSTGENRLNIWPLL